MDLRQIHTDVMVSPLDKFEGQGQSSRSPWTKLACFGPFRGLHAVYIYIVYFANMLSTQTEEIF